MEKNLRTHLDLCIMHVTQEDAERLSEQGDDYSRDSAARVTLPCVQYRYGAIIFVLYSGETPEEQAAYLDRVKAEGYSDALCNLIRLAWKLDVDMIRLDNDAEINESLPTFAW
jgi:hypothetical protein